MKTGVGYWVEVLDRMRMYTLIYIYSGCMVLIGIALLISFSSTHQPKSTYHDASLNSSFLIRTVISL